MSNTRIENRAHTNRFKSRRGGVNPCQTAVQETADGAQEKVVLGYLVGITVDFYITAPCLPKCRCPVLNHVAPRRILSSKQQPVVQICKTRIREHIENVLRTENPGRQGDSPAA